MAPNVKAEETTLVEDYDFIAKDPAVPPNMTPWKYEYILSHVIVIGYCYFASLYGMYLFFFEAKWSTVLINLIFNQMGAMGVSAGAHRYFSHKSFKANLPLQIILMLFHSIAYQKTLVSWVMNHRLHHKYSDTDADPHNSYRGLFFSQVGWLVVKCHPEVQKRKQLVDMRDVYSNPVIMFQKRNSTWLLPLCGFILPTWIMWMFGETLSIAWFTNIFRFIFTLNVTNLAASLAHYHGPRPYDKNIKPCDSTPFLYLGMGEGFHNYHHVFPWDYRASEREGTRMNFTTVFIDFFGKIGWAYDFKSVSEEMIKARMKRTGDGTDLWGQPIVDNEIKST